MNLRSIITMFGSVLNEIHEGLTQNQQEILDYIQAALSEANEANENTLAELREELREQTSELYHRSSTVYRLESELRQANLILENLQKANVNLLHNAERMLEPIMRQWYKANILRPADNNMKKVYAIKYAREMSGLGLKEAKDWVEAFIPRLEQEHEDWLDEQSQIGGSVMMDGTAVMVVPTLTEYDVYKGGMRGYFLAENEDNGDEFNENPRRF